MAHAIRILYPTRYSSSITQLRLPLFPFPKQPISSNKINFPKISHKPRFFSHFSAMAGESETFYTTNTSPSVEVLEENIKFGFERGEIYKSNLAGTVDSYDRHLFLCYKSHESWPPRVEDSDADPLPKLLASALKARKNDIAVKTRLTICEGGDDVKLMDGDVLVFPEMVLYRGLKDSDVDSFVKDVLVDGKSWASGVQEELTGSYVFVCAHNNRDRRCGVCGPVLIEKFKEEIESKDLKNQVFLTACSHVGGHKYAGNVITFSAGPDGKIAGNWYGYVTPNDVLELLDKQIGEGEVIDRIWRGQMGAPVIEAEKIDEPTHANGTNVNNEKQLRETNAKDKTKSVQSCCQGVNGVSCCQADSVEPKSTKREVEGLSNWMGKWDQPQVLTTAAMVGAVATVAVAYSLYRRAR